MDQNVSAVILLIGLAVGVDYSLFYIKREREERAAGRARAQPSRQPRRRPAAPCSISGITVIDRHGRDVPRRRQDLPRFGIATIMVVGVSMIGSLTVLPALLSRLGDKVDKGKIPFLHRLRRERLRTVSGRRS